MTTTQETPRAKLIRKIKALLSKRIESGATEAEAFSALEKAQSMMRAHGLDQDALDAEAFVQETFAGRETRKQNWTYHLAYGVSLFTGTFGFAPGGSMTAIQFNGRESDVIFATWLVDSLDAFVNRQALAYLASTGGARVKDAKRGGGNGGPDLFGGGLPAVRCSTVSSPFERQRMMQEFGKGVCLRLSQRLLELADADARRRHAKARAELESKGMSFNKARRQAMNVTSHTMAGMKAGDAAAFNKPMGGSSAKAPLQIAAA